MTYKYTNIKRVISKVFSDLNLQEEAHKVSDMIEWAGEALEKIGAFPTLQIRIAGKDGDPLLELSNYQSRLPAGFHKLIQVAYSTTENGPFYPMRYATGSFDAKSTLTSSNTIVGTSPESDLITLAMSLYDLTYVEALDKLNNEPSTKSLLQSLLLGNVSSNGSRDGTDYTIDYTYLITDNYIKTNIQTGYLMMSYQCIPLDINGYPLIPDDDSFIEALYWYINMKLMYPEWKQGTIRDAVYFDARRSWNFYAKQAYGNALMPSSTDELESIKNTWLSLVPRITEHNTFYSTTGERQIIYNN